MIYDFNISVHEGAILLRCTVCLPKGVAESGILIEGDGEHDFSRLVAAVKAHKHVGAPNSKKRLGSGKPFYGQG